jgi:hypothetical protein
MSDGGAGSTVERSGGGTGCPVGALGAADDLVLAGGSVRLGSSSAAILVRGADEPLIRPD